MPNSSQLKLSIAPNGNIRKTILNPLKVNVNAVFEGGGPRGLVYVGVIKALSEQGIYPDIRLVVGSSAGALTALTIALGFSADEAAEVLKNVRPLELLNPKTRDLLKSKDNKPDKTGIARKLLKDGFLDDGEQMQKYIEAILTQRMLSLLAKFPDNKYILEAVKKKGKITFRDLDNIKKTCPGADIKDVVLTGTKKSGNSANSECKLFDVKSTPDMPIAVAGRISASIPYFFQSVNYDGNTYCDGGCANNFPAEVAELPEYAPRDVYLVKSRGDVGQNLCTVGFKVDEKEEMQKIMSEDVKNITTSSFLSGVVNNIVGNFTENAPHTERLDMLKAMLIYKHQTCVISDLDVSLFEFALDDKKKQALIEEGYKEANKWLTNMKLNEKLEETEYSSAADLCKDMTLEEFETFREILARYPAEIFYGEEKDIDALSHRFNYLTMDRIHEEKKASAILKYNDVNAHFYHHTKQSAIFLSIFASLRRIQDANKIVLTKIIESSQEEYKKEIGHLKDFILQDFYIQQMLSLLKSISDKVTLTDVKMNSLLYQAILPILEINSATKDDANFLKTSAMRSQGIERASIYWNCVSMVYRKLYSELWEQHKTNIDIKGILSAMQSKHSEIEKIILEIHTRLPQQSEEEKAKYFLKSLEDLAFPELRSIIKFVAKEQKLENYKLLDLSQMQKSLHPLLDKLSSEIDKTLNGSNPNPDLILSFVNETLKKERSNLHQESKYWSVTTINDMIKKSLESIEKNNTPMKTKSHPLEEDDTTHIDISRFYAVSSQIDKLLAKEFTTDKSPVEIASDLPKLRLRESSGGNSGRKSPERQNSLKTFSLWNNESVDNKDHKDQFDEKQVFSKFFEFVEEKFTASFSSNRQGNDVGISIVDYLNKLRRESSTKFNTEFLSGQWNESHISSALDNIAKRHDNGINSAAVHSLKERFHDVIVSNLTRNLSFKR